MDLNVYNYLLADFNSKSVAKYSTHKDSELRSVLHNIAKLTKTSPVYLVKLSDARQSYALDVKESAISLNAAFRDLSDDSEESVFYRKKAMSSDGEQVEVDIQTKDYDRLPEPFSLQVHKLARSQVNESREFYETGKGLPAGTYHFKIRINDMAYDFQYNIKKDVRHREVLGGLADFISRAKIGIRAETLSREAGKLTMRLETDITGTPDGGPVLTLEDREDGQKEGIVSYYGLDRVSVQPQNAEFSLNGVSKHSMSNTFMLARSLEVTLKHISDQEAQIEYIPDSEKVLEKVSGMADTYNHIAESSWKYAGDQEKTPKLVREIRTLFRPYESELESCGITFDEKGRMQIDDSLAQQAAVDGSFQQLFGRDSQISMKMLAKTESIKIDPMEYVDKIIVSYPNTGKPAVGYSYTTSLYSGLLFNYYC